MTMITPSYLGETIEYSSLHACRSTLEDPTAGYAIAAYVAASRLHDNDHWLSDVVFGSATGTIAGRTVVHHASDYWAFTPAPLPGGGVVILVSRTAVAR